MNEPPSSSQVSAVLTYLQGSLGLKGADLLKVLKAFPEALGLRCGPGVREHTRDHFVSVHPVWKVACSRMEERGLLGTNT